jgi:RHS repeat-associated protein
MPGGYVVNYTQDGDSHRVGKNVSGQTTKYVYDGDTVVAEIAPSGTITYELPGIGYVNNGVQYYYHGNAQGSALAVQNSAGSMQGENEYDGYGISYSLVSGPHSDFGYVGSKGYVGDNESGLLELVHRYYLPVIGRFLTQDPIGQKDDLNLYEYCKDNPLVAVDPSGEDEL